jgi:transcriptional regulator with XRE-family HTH domain
VKKNMAEGLNDYAIGSKIKALRRSKKLGLLELSKHTGLSPALLSKLERDVMHPTLPTLLRIATVFGVGLDHFFTPEPRRVFAIVRKKDRLRFPDSPDSVRPAFNFESLDFPVTNRACNSYLAEFEPLDPGQGRTHEHSGIEFLYLISGKLEIEAGEEKYVLEEGDAVYFDSTVPHAYRRIGTKRTTAIVVTLTPRQ